MNDARVMRSALGGAVVESMPRRSRAIAMLGLQWGCRLLGRVCLSSYRSLTCANGVLWEWWRFLDLGRGVQRTRCFVLSYLLLLFLSADIESIIAT